MQVMRGDAAGKARHLGAVGDKVGSAGDGHGPSREAGARHGGALGGVHRVGTVHSAGTVAGSVFGRVVPESPQLSHGDDLRGVAAQDSGGILAHSLDELGAQAADADAHRIEHPRLARPRAGARRGGNRLLVDGQQGPQVNVHGPSQGCDAFALVGQIHHGRRAADGQLGVGDEVLGHGVGDGRRQRVRLAHLVHGAGHERPKLCLGSGAAGRASVCRCADGAGGRFGHDDSFPEAEALACGRAKKKDAPCRKRPLCLVSMLPTTVLADRFEGLGKRPLNRIDEVAMGLARFVGAVPLHGSSVARLAVGTGGDACLALHRAVSEGKVEGEDADGARWSRERERCSMLCYDAPHDFRK